MNKRAIIVIGLSVVLMAGNVFAWGPGTHQSLTQNIFSDSLISGFLTEFGIDSNAVITGSDDLDYDKSNAQWAPLHSGQWTTFTNRQYVEYVNAPSKWYTTSGLDETRRLKYLMHNVMDVGVPMGHSPANQVYINGTAENWLELQVDTWSDYPGPPTTTYAGTMSQVISQFQTDCLANAAWLKSTGTNIFGSHGTDNNRTAGWEGTSISMKLAKAFLTDYFLAKRSVVAEAGSGYAVKAGGVVELLSTGSQDPDSITWATNGTFTNNGGGIASVKWDLDGNGTYETTDASPSKTHAQLAGALGYSETGKTVTVQVTDDEGKVAYDTTTVKIYSDPSCDAGSGYSVDFSSSLNLAAVGSDADGGNITQWLWDIDGDGEFDDATGQNVVLSFEALLAMGLERETNYTIKLKVIDNDQGDWQGQSVGTAVLSVGVPEPATMSLIGLGAAALIRHRRK